MARFKVTPILMDGIRMARLQNGITSKKLAEILYRSPAYISKLERGDLKKIEESELTSIICEVIPGDQPLSEKLETLVKFLMFRYTPKEIERELWLENYDWVICKIQVPPQLPKNISKLKEDSGISLETLGAAINSNAELSESVRNDMNVPINQWEDGTTRTHIMKLKIELSEISQFLDGKILQSNYLLPYVIVRFLYWLAHYPKENEMSDERGKEATQYAIQFLNSFQFFSISEKWRTRLRVDSASSPEKISVGKSTNFMGQLNPVYSDELNVFLRLFEKGEPGKILDNLQHINANLKWDQPFMHKLMSLPFSCLNGMSFSNKKALLTEIEEAIQRYANLPEDQKCLDSYD